MSIEKQLGDRVRAAYTGFKNRVSAETHSRALELLERIHHEAHAVLDKSEGQIFAPEFAHALAALDKIPEGSRTLPSDVSEFETIVTSEGQLLGVDKWELLDPGWLEALEQWLIHFDDHAPFNTEPQLIHIDDQVTFAVAGDWGTGIWRDQSPSQKVGKQISEISADYTIHLGDVYYAGTAEQESENLVKLWPMGAKGGFTLNSNHEMYNGANSYYQEALTQKFTQQKGCSYFALQNADWLIIGLDSAYHSDPFTLYMDGKIGADQSAWLAQLPQGKRTIVLSHHQSYDFSGSEATDLFDEVSGALGKAPDIWYWGHLHNAIVYQPANGFYGRCIGHGSIPYGDAWALQGNGQVAWYETLSANDPEIPERVMNGFMKLELNGAEITETYIDEDGVVRYQYQPQFTS